MDAVDGLRGKDAEARDGDALLGLVLAVGGGPVDDEVGVLAGEDVRRLGGRVAAEGDGCDGDLGELTPWPDGAGGLCVVSISVNGMLGVCL